MTASETDSAHPGGIPPSPEALAGSFSGTVERVPVHLGYRVGLVAVTLVILALPLVYAALIVAVGYGVYLHATLNTGLLGRGTGLHGWLLYLLLLYLGPIVVGMLLVLFMVKPLFAPPPRPPAPVALDPARFPTLFGFVGRLRETLGAPMPRAIHVDCAVNASAGPLRGFFSLLTGDLLLTIGMPLVAGMSARQLAGVLAHELGHFAQGSGMRLSYLVRSVNAWFARVVYQRDALDVWLARNSTEADGRIALILMAARFLIWLTRRLLWALMMAGHAVSSFMLRQMELDADRYEARLAGSEVFRDTALRLRVLTVAAQRSIETLAESWSDRRLVEDLPSFVAAVAETLPPDGVEQGAGILTPSVFDTHPPDEARIASAERERAPGVFRLEAPARLLFDDYEALLREATRAFYEREQGVPLEGVELLPVSSFTARHTAALDAARVAEDYLRGTGSLEDPLPLPEQGPAPPADAREALDAASDAARAASELAGRLAPARTGPGPIPRLGALRDAVAKRVSCGLALALGETATTTSSGDRAAEISRLHAAAVRLGALHETFGSLAGELRSVMDRLEAAQRDPEAISREAFEHAVRIVTLKTEKITRALADMDYPFDHSAGRLSVADWALADAPEVGAFEGSALARADALLQRSSALYRRALVRLAVIARDAEQAATARPRTGEDAP